MISDVKIDTTEITPVGERPYTGEYDCVTKLRGKKYPLLEKQMVDGKLVDREQADRELVNEQLAQGM